MQNHHWPGNVRELELMLKRLFVSTSERKFSLAAVEKELEKSISLQPVIPTESQVPSENLSHAVEFHLSRYFRALDGEEPAFGLYEQILTEVERPLILATLHHTSGNQIRAAAILGLNRNTLRKKIRELKISTDRTEYR